MVSADKDPRLTALVVVRCVGALAVCGFLACALTPLPNIAAGWLAEPSVFVKSDAIVVLGASVRPDGELGEPSLRRAIVGIKAFHKGAAPLLVFAGSSTTGSLTEAEVRRTLARDLVVPSEAILVVDRALTTRDEARRVALLLGNKGLRTITIVSDSLHLRRARRVFEREGFSVGVVAADSIAQEADAPEDRLRLARSVAQQAVALVYYRIAG